MTGAPTALAPPRSRFRRWRDAGFAELISVTVPNCPLSPQSEIQPGDRGKAPGRLNRSGFWSAWNWREHKASDADLERWDASGANIGLLTEFWPALDCDVDEPTLAAALNGLAAEMLGAAPVRCRAGSARWLRLYRWPVPQARTRIEWRRPGPTAPAAAAAAAGSAAAAPPGLGLAQGAPEGRLEALELLGDGQQTVVQGTHPSGAKLAWTKRPIAAELTEITAEQIEAFFDAALLLVELSGGTAARRETASAPGRQPMRPLELTPAARAELAAVASFLPCAALDRHDWVRYTAAWKRWSGGDEQFYAETLEPWALEYPDNTPEVVRKLWDSINAAALDGDFLCAQARAAGYQGAGTAAGDFDPVPVQQRSPRLEAALAGYTDEALALYFASKHADDLRFVAVWGKWLFWDGQRWAIDDTRLATDLVRQALREIISRRDGKADAAGAPPGAPAGLKKKIVAVLESAKTIASVEKLATTDRRLARSADIWDRDPWLLNTPAGVVDLKTGQVRAHDPALHMTRITAVAPARARAPIFELFLSRTCAGNAELIGFLQRIIGYALTGSTREHALFFFYGHGANGKSVLLSTASGMLGEYAITAPMETFIASPNDRHPTEIASLRGARLVTATETEEGRRWAEAKISQLTGGDRVSARFMRQDFFHFTPQFKLIVAGNHKPGLRGVGEAIKRRMNMIPFSVTIPVEERDQDLPEKLRAEWGAILAWAIAGCLAWQKGGLQAPALVADATAQYIASEDVFGQWLSEACELDAASLAASAVAVTSSADLYQSWQQWANAAGESVWSRKRFAQQLETRGGDAVTLEHTRRGTVVRGLRLKALGGADFAPLGAGEAASNVIDLVAFKA